MGMKKPRQESLYQFCVFPFWCFHWNQSPQCWTKENIQICAISNGFPVVKQEDRPIDMQSLLFISA